MLRSLAGARLRSSPIRVNYGAPLDAWVTQDGDRISLFGLKHPFADSGLVVCVISRNGSVAKSIFGLTADRTHFGHCSPQALRANSIAHAKSRADKP